MATQVETKPIDAVQVETKQVDAVERQQARKSEAPSRFAMVQGIRREIVEMLAAKKRGFSADDYRFLGILGILDEDDRIELIDGEIVIMSPIGSKHVACVNAVSSELLKTASGRAIVSTQNPIRLGDNSEPQPDIALLRPRDDFYAEAHPAPDDILLLVEVADSSLERDREKARDTYAKHGIPELWIANLRDEVVERHRNPTPDGYEDVRVFNRGDTISPELLPDVELAVDDILP